MQKSNIKNQNDKLKIKNKLLKFILFFFVFLIFDFSFLIYKTSASLIIRTPSSLGLSSGLVGYWTFDGSKISGTSALDSSGLGNTGTITGATKVVGKLGQALSFNGGENNVNAGSASSLDDLASSTSGLTVSAWVKPDTLTNYDMYSRIVDKGRRWYFSASTFWVDYDDTDLIITLRPTTSASGIPIGAWTHVIITWDGSNSASGFHFYKNGVEITDFQSTQDGVGNRLTDSAGNLVIGARADGGSPQWDGTLDDVRVYSRALSADEAKRLYNMGAASKVNKTPTNSLTSGLVGHWTFDGTKISGTSALDSSGLGNTGTITGATKAMGKIGQALSFNGTSNYVNIAQTSGLPIYSQTNYSVSFFVKGGIQNDKKIFAEGWSGGDTPQFAIGTLNGGKKIRMYIRNDANSAVLNRNSTTDVFDGSWHHVVWVDANGTADLYIDGVLDATDFDYSRTGTFTLNRSAIGVLMRNYNAYYFDGLIDDVRVYNRALSLSEIQKLYNISKGLVIKRTDYTQDSSMVSYWMMEQATGTDAPDGKGRNNLPHTSDGPGPTQSADAKQGTYSVDFNEGLWETFQLADGSLSVGFPGKSSSGSAGSFSIGGWVKLDISGDRAIMSKYSNGDSMSFGLLFDDPNIRFFLSSNGWGSTSITGGTTIIDDGSTWYHVVGVFDTDANLIYVYVNGVRDAVPVSFTSDMFLGISNFGIGRFDGHIDEAFIMSRALSAKEVAEIYAHGLAGNR